MGHDHELGRQDVREPDNLVEWVGRCTRGHGDGHMSSSAIVLALAVFGASAVEAVEALTIVLAAGTSQGLAIGC